MKTGRAAAAMETPEGGPSPTPTGTVPPPNSAPDATLRLPTTFGELAAMCVAQVQLAVPPASDAVIEVDYRSARWAARPDSLKLVEVPYTATTTVGETTGSYVCGIAERSAGVTFLFLSDHERLSVAQWNDYASAARPGNLEAPR